MKKLMSFALSAAVVFAFIMSAPVRGAEKLPDGNLLRNPEFRSITQKGKVECWKIYQNDSAECVVKNAPSEMNIVNLESLPPGKSWHKFGNLLLQQVENPPAGPYVYGADLAPSRKFRQLIILLMYKGKDGKTVFTGTTLKHVHYPAPGKWIRLVGETEIPAGIKQLSFCIEIRASEAGGNVLVKSPFLQWKEE